MKFLVILASLFAVAHAQLSIAAPAKGDVLQVGKNVDIQINVLDLPKGVGLVEASLVIGISECGQNACPDSDVVIGFPLFTGSYLSKAPLTIGGKPGSFETFSIPLPKFLTGNGTTHLIKAQRSFLFANSALPREFQIANSTDAVQVVVD